MRRTCKKENMEIQYKITKNNVEIQNFQYETKLSCSKQLSLQ